MKKIIILLILVFIVGCIKTDEEIIAIGCDGNEIRKNGKCLRDFSTQEIDVICDYLAKKEWNMSNPDCEYFSWGSYTEGEEVSCDCINCLEWAEKPTIKKEHSYQEGYTYCKDRD